MDLSKINAFLEAERVTFHTKKKIKLKWVGAGCIQSPPPPTRATQT